MERITASLALAGGYGHAGQAYMPHTSDKYHPGKKEMRLIQYVATEHFTLVATCRDHTLLPVTADPRAGTNTCAHLNF